MIQTAGAELTLKNDPEINDADGQMRRVEKLNGADSGSVRFIRSSKPTEYPAHFISR